MPAVPKPGGAAKPAMQDVAAEPAAVIDTSVGKLTCILFPDKAPKAVANFVGLATGTKDWRNPVNGANEHGVPLYDGTIFHRVIPNFMIQGGDHAGDGTGGPGYKFKNEVSSDLLFDKPGRLAYANSGPDTNGSQFFITEVATPYLNGKNTIFGQCDEASVELVMKITRMATDPSNARPVRPVKINHISIVRVAGTGPYAAARNLEDGKAELATFEQKTAAWRAMATKPPISDEVYKDRLLAEDALKNKDMDGALSYYEAGVAADPTWAQGWYNAAMLYAEQKDYFDAANCMKHYLILVPDAPDAKAAKDSVILWEAKARTAKP